MAHAHEIAAAAYANIQVGWNMLWLMWKEFLHGIWSDMAYVQVLGSVTTCRWDEWNMVWFLCYGPASTGLNARMRPVFSFWIAGCKECMDGC